MSKALSTFFLVTSVISTPAYSITLSIGGGSFVTFNGQDGNTIADGSIVQIGYFSGVPLATLPSTFGQTEWDSFTPFLGVDSSNSDSRNIFTSNILGPGTFESAVQVATDTDNLPTVPLRLGVRVFDSTSSTNSYFNTLSSDLDPWILELPAGTPVTPGTGRGDINIDSFGQADLFFEDNANRFTTSLLAIPEPSSSILLLGAGLLLGARRRK